MRDYSKACSFYKRAVDIAQQSLPAKSANVLEKCGQRVEFIMSALFFVFRR
jgi:hypothetical protein